MPARWRLRYGKYCRHFRQDKEIWAYLFLTEQAIFSIFLPDCASFAGSGGSAELQVCQPMIDQNKPTTVNYWATLTLSALAIRLIVAFILFGSFGQNSDAFYYADQARRLLKGEAWDQPFFWPVGRSLALLPFFWLFGTSEAVVKANSVAIDVGCVLLAAMLAHQVLRKSAAARLAGWLAVFYPPMVLCSGWSFPSNFTMLGLLGSASLGLLAYQQHNRWFLSLTAWFASACCLGLAMLTRPSATAILLLAICAAISCLLIHLMMPTLASKWKVPSAKTIIISGVGFFCGIACLTGPILRHHVSLGAGWVLSTNNERNFFLGNNPYTPLYKTWHWGQHPPPESLKAYFSSFQREPNPRQAMMHEALRYIASRPDLFLLRTVNRIRAYWGFDYLVTANVQTIKPTLGKPLLLMLLGIEAGGYCLLMFFVISGLFLFSKSMEAKHVALLIALVLAYMLPYTIAFANGKYHFPVMGFLFPFAAIGVSEAWQRRNGPWAELLRNRWFWIAITVFIFIQLEYAYQVSMYYFKR